MPGAQLINPNGAYGGVQNDPNNGELLCAPMQSAETVTTISAGQVVSVTTAGKILQATTAVEPRLTIGIAVNAIAPGASGLVAMHGPMLNVPAQGAIAAGDLVSRSGTTAGSVASLTSAAGTTGQAIGIAINAASGNLVNVFVVKM